MLVKCPHCHNDVKLTYSSTQQTVIIGLLFLGLFFGIVYLCFARKRTCSCCGCYVKKA